MKLGRYEKYDMSGTGSGILLFDLGSGRTVVVLPGAGLRLQGRARQLFAVAGRSCRKGPRRHSGVPCRSFRGSVGQYWG